MKSICIFLFIFLLIENIDSQSFGGTLSGSSTVCAGSNNGLLTLSNYSGGILRWETANTINGPWFTIAHTSHTFNYLNLQQSAFFRVAVQANGFSIAYSNVVQIICNAPTTAGTISASTIQCLGTNVDCLLSANVGTTITWQYSQNNWISANNFGSINSHTTTFNNLSVPTQIRALIQNGSCPSSYTNSLTLVPTPLSVSGTILGTQAVCFGTDSVTLSLLGYTGAVIGWERALSVSGSFTPIPNSAKRTTLKYPFLNQNNYFKAVVQNANCSTVVSNVFSVSVSPLSVGGNATGTSSVCSGTNSGTLQLAGHTGAIMHWEYSNNSGTSWNVITNTTSVQLFNNINTNRVYRTSVQSGLCPASYSSEFTVTVKALPSPTFVASAGCENSVRSFTNLSTGAVSYNWDFGDGNTSIMTNPTNNYTTSGTYTIKLVCFSSDACADSNSSTITIYPRPIASFLSADSACFGAYINFYNNSSISSGSVTNITFKFNDGSADNSNFNFNHKFPLPGSYTVVNIAESIYGCRDSTSKVISILDKPQANFILNNICKGSVAIPVNQSSIASGTLNYQWHFGNSEISSLENPAIYNLNTGIYTVALISSSEHYCSDTVYKNFIVHETPTLQLQANNVCFGQETDFTVQITPTLSGLSYTLNFGDTSNTNVIPSKHSYDKEGVFYPNIVCLSDSGCMAVATNTVVVFEKPTSSFISNNICQFDTLVFLNTSFMQHGTLDYLWVFNVGDSSKIKNPTKHFTIARIYSVTLIAKSNHNCYDTASTTIKVYDKPESEFLFNNVCDGSSISFTNTSRVKTGHIAKHYWQFGDNESGVNASPLKSYLNSGSYSVSLTVETNNTCTDTRTKMVTVYEKPIANFSATAVCLNTPSVFDNTSTLKTGGFTSLWDFGNGNISELNSPIQYFKKSGLLPVTLKIRSDRGCKDSITKFVDVFHLPQLLISADTVVEKGMEILLQASGAFNYSWYPTESLSNPLSEKTLARPSSSTKYFLFAENANACTAIDSIEITVRDNFIIMPYNILTPNNNGKNDTWIIKHIDAYPENEVLIFDQWNQIVYEKNNYQNEWEGKNMRGEILPDATYFYILSIKGKEKKYMGYITLLRNAE